MSMTLRHPVADGHARRRHSSGRSLFSWWELRVHAAAVDVELFAQVFGAHAMSAQVPAGEAHRPGRRASA